MEAAVFLQLGSNMGNSVLIMDQAMANISTKIGTITRQSTWYQTAAWGYTEQPDFLNLVLQVSTPLSAEDLLTACLDIERAMGRKRNFKNAQRTIDIDILLYGHLVIESEELTIPHPAMQQRRFVLMPMAELAPNLIHPVIKKSFALLLAECTDNLAVKKYSRL